MNPLDPMAWLKNASEWAALSPTEFADRLSATARNMTELMLHGRLVGPEERSPFAVAAKHENFALRRYFPDDVPLDLPPVVLVPPLMMMADVFDVAPKSSSVRSLHELNIDAWVVDFGRPEAEPGGLKRTMSDHILAVSDAVDIVRDATGRDVVLGGYSQGGLFCYLATAFRRNEGVDSILAFGSPVDFTAGPMPTPMSSKSLISMSEGLLKLGVARHVSLPAWFNRTATQMLDPMKTIEFRMQYLMQLHDREKLLPGEQQRTFLDDHGWTAFAGPAFENLMENVMVTNRVIAGGMVVGNTAVTLADLELPILTVAGEADTQGHPLAIRRITHAAPCADVYELNVSGGHFGIVAGSGARKATWPRVADWLRWRTGKGILPEAIVPAAQVDPDFGWKPGPFREMLQNAADLGIDMTRSALETAGEIREAAISAGKDYAAGIPALASIEALRDEADVSLGLLLDRAAANDPDGVAVMYDDRVIRHSELKARVDDTAKRLLSVGVRQGERVGMLMQSDPEAVCVLAAISRIGAVAVILRPGKDLSAEAQLGKISRLICDTESAAAVSILQDVEPYVVTGSAEDKELPTNIVRLDRIDLNKVQIPGWYQSNPSRANETMFVQFDSAGPTTRSRPMTNRDWVLSALGSAKAGEVDSSDTIYSTTPLHHQVGLVVAFGAAILSGARLALSSGDDADTFWQEVRRYGATHVTYSDLSLRTVAYAAPDKREPHHPIRRLMGFGMPADLWNRVAERFAPADVVAIYCASNGTVVLASAPGIEVGASLRPVFETTVVAVAPLEPGDKQLEHGPNGLARQCAPDETGLLLSRTNTPDGSDGVIRDVFQPNDAWRSTGDLFVRDAEGGFRFVQPANNL